MESGRTRNIVIVGGGIIGCTTAYFLTRHPKFDPSLHRITLLEASSIAANASGKAGGLLALWAYPECLVPLSYSLHAELAKEHGGVEKWGYRSNLGCGSVFAKVTAEDVERRRKASEDRNKQMSKAGDEDAHEHGDQQQQQQQQQEWAKLPKQDERASGLFEESALPANLDWIDSSMVEAWEEMRPRRHPAAATETAQVHPFHFTNAIADLARASGVDIRLRAKVTRIGKDRTGPSGSTTVEYVDRDKGEDATVTMDDVTDVVVTAGPWTGRLLPRSRVEGTRAHSTVYEAHVSPHAVFTQIHLPADYVPEHRRQKGQVRRHKGTVDPEAYARPGREVYVCDGRDDNPVPLPSTADQIQVNLDTCLDLEAYMGLISPELAGAPIKARQACYLPMHRRFDGKELGPLIGQTAVPGIWIAAGHSCWGIQNGPATGCLMAELLLDGKATSADISSLSPDKFKV